MIRTRLMTNFQTIYVTCITVYLKKVSILVVSTYNIFNENNDVVIFVHSQRIFEITSN